jgi:hypothetical protein
MFGPLAVSTGPHSFVSRRLNWKCWFANDGEPNLLARSALSVKGSSRGVLQE